jgi:hypothetical protein
MIEIRPIQWIDSKLCYPPHKITHPDKFIKLAKCFSDTGWNLSKQPLIGYHLDKIQLISGSHRWAAANKVGIKIPVILYEYEYIKNIWGTDDWVYLLKTIEQIRIKNND